MNKEKRCACGGPLRKQTGCVRKASLRSLPHIGVSFPTEQSHKGQNQGTEPNRSATSRACNWSSVDLGSRSPSGGLAYGTVCVSRKNSRREAQPFLSQAI